MNFDDEKTREFEERFAKQVAELKEFVDSGKWETVKSSLNEILPALQEMVLKPEKTEEEAAYLAQTFKRLLPVITSINDMRLILGEKNFRTANLFYEHWKKLADAGDEKAKEIIKNLEDSRRKAFKAGFDEN